jgi:hypothetical protein
MTSNPIKSTFFNNPIKSIWPTVVRSEYFTTKYLLYKYWVPARTTTFFFFWSLGPLNNFWKVLHTCLQVLIVYKKVSIFSSCLVLVNRCVCQARTSTPPTNWWPDLPACTTQRCSLIWLQKSEVSFNKDQLANNKCLHISNDCAKNPFSTG